MDDLADARLPRYEGHALQQREVPRLVEPVPNHRHPVHEAIDETVLLVERPPVRRYPFREPDDVPEQKRVVTTVTAFTRVGRLIRHRPDERPPTREFRRQV